MKLYQVTIETLHGEYHQYQVESKSTCAKLCDSIFNQTPNVRGVDVRPLTEINK